MTKRKNEQSDRKAKILMEVDGAPDPSVYTTQGKETILPHTNLTGGIEGLKQPYPPIKHREFEGETQQTETLLTDIKGTVLPVATAPVSDREAELLAKVAMLEQEVSNKVTVEPMEYPQENDLDPYVRAPAPAHPTSTAPPEYRQPTPICQPPPSMVPAPKAPDTAVTFSGAFGTMTAPFMEVVKGDKCVSLTRDPGGAFNYKPPVNPEVEFQLEWTDARTGQGVKTSVINAGVDFTRADGMEVIVLLLVDY